MKKDNSANEKRAFFKSKRQAVIIAACGAVALVLAAVGIFAALGNGGKQEQPAPEESPSAPALETQEITEPSEPPVPSESQQAPEVSEAVPSAAPSESAKASAPRKESKPSKAPAVPSQEAAPVSGPNTDVHTHEWIPKTMTYTHPEEYKIIHHEAEYQTVHHDAVTQVKYRCNGCGQLMLFAQKQGHKEYAASIGKTSCLLGGYKEEIVEISPAYDETVLVRNAWDEPVLVREEWDEVIILGYICTCGEIKQP